VGICANLKHLCTKQAFIGNRTSDRCTPQKKATPPTIFRVCRESIQRLKTKGLNALQ